ncbi:Protein of uncharacterised function (DUF1524) [Leminorella grimontii]|nr:HNH endonuclease family protein [Leminorella grimontii]VFS56738.1 Protein of uncharacterised function (DUF1524) [Leminorella grimontii]
MILKDIYKYFYFDEREHREIKKCIRVRIGHADDDFYQSLIEQRPLEPQRNSHHLMMKAKKHFNSFFIDELFSQKNIAECLEVVDEIVKLFDESFLVIHIVTNSIDEAYKLFTVLNDRGINLTEGELLKAYTIGICGNDNSRIRKISDDWDFILKYPSKKVTNYLRWIITMVTGNNITASSVLDEYKNSFLKETLHLDKLEENISFLRSSVEKLEYISDGAWPFDSTSKDVNWYRGKLDLLINKLKHTHAMPLLLAASYSSEDEFKNITNEVCKFFIRCKMISELHASLFSSLYPSLAKDIYNNRDRYTVDSLHNAFNRVISEKDHDNMRFSSGIRGLLYQRKGDNKPIKCLLITIQENWIWLELPNQGSSKNRLKKEDKSVSYDFNNMTLEHIYPHSISEGNKKPEIEKLKNTIGNIVILDPNKNSQNSNKDFKDKKDSFLNTGIGIHKWISNKDDWTENDIKELTEKYIEYAIKVFSFH